MRDLLTEQMSKSGELPPGMRLDLPEVYIEMTGQGELWVGENGMPVSQSFNLTFPKGSFDEIKKQTSFQISVRFSQFTGFPETAVSSPGTASPSRLSQILQQGQEAVEKTATPGNLFTILAIVTAICTMLVVMRQSHKKPVYAAVALSVCISMLISPMLSSIHVAAYSEEQANKKAAQEARQAEADQASSWQEALTQTDFSPHASPLDSAKSHLGNSQAGQSSLMGSGVITATSSSSQYFDSSCETDPGADNDGDSLTNLQECLIGTLPGAADTDQDGLDDGVEVKGFVLNNETWYTNPLQPDTNRDGLPDSSEWYMDVNNDGLPDDTDGDGIPDVWDDDNDGDGVPDDLDLSPFSTTKDSNIFDGDNPFQLIVNDLEEGTITKVELQLSPTNPDHLWYTNNVLDWADNDRQGQMQDADGLSFYDVDNSINPWPNDLGDVRLVPMLEIKMTGTPNNLLDQDTLDLFGISVLTETADTKTAYVPVQLVTDNTGNKNVAFHGAMYYRADSSWGNAQSVHLVWLVQALVDVCETYKDGVCDTYSSYNNLQVIHDYDEEWYLTGMEVSEERGTNMAIIYEDPAETDDDPLYMETLYEMAYGLDSTFMAGADCEHIDTDDECVSGNGKLDLTVTGIYTRFNHTTNSSVPDEKRWQLSNVLSVEDNSYESVELAMLDTVITQTVDVLNSTFTGVWTAENPITPTVMFAWEHSYRAVSLSSNNLSWSDNILTVDVATNGDNIIQVEQENGMKWAPYSYTVDDGWNAADINDYWNNLDNLLPDYMSGSSDVATDVTLGKLLYLGMYGGETNYVSYGDLITTKDYQTNDKPLGVTFASGAGTGIKNVIAFYYGDTSIVRRIITNAVYSLDEDINVLQRFTQQISDSLSSLYAGIRSFGAFGIGLITIASFAILIGAGLYLYRNYVAHDNLGTGWLVAGAITLGVIAFVFTVFRPLKSMIGQISVLVEIGEAENTLEAVQTVFGTEGAPSIEYNVLGLVIGISLAIVIFAVLVFSGQVKVGTIAFDSLLAQTIAAIWVAMIIFIISLTGIGALLLGIATAVDLILEALGVNFSIVGKLTDAIASALYEFDIAVDTGVQTGGISTYLVNPDDGMVAGNQLVFTMPVTTVITQSTKLFLPISEDSFRSTSYAYSFDQYDAYQSGLSTTHGDRSDEWQVTTTIESDGSTSYSGFVTDTVSYQTTLKAGINQANIFYLDTAYDLLGESCWKLYLTCKKKYVDGTSSTEVGSSFIFDIYPATIDGFVDVTSWSDGNLRFPDADGDGLLPLGEGGLDPDDSTWDYDGDDLSDSFEMSMRSLTVEEGGQALDPMLMDTDGDGLLDKEELLLATNPANADSDNDGLPDIDEAARVDEIIPALSGGWLFAYSINAFTRVWSSPTSADYDGDGMSDLFELTQDTCPACTPWADPDNPQLFSPYVYNENPVPIYLDDNTNNGFVSPSGSFVYSTTTENNLSAGILLAGDVVLDLPDIFSGSPLTAEISLNSGYSETLLSEIDPMSANSATGILTSSIDLTALEDAVWSWDLPLLNTDTPESGSIKQLDAATSPEFSDLYVYTALEIDDAGQQYITAYTIGDDYVASDATVLGSFSPSVGTLTAPEVACNNVGNCLVVWAVNDLSGTSGTGEVLGVIMNNSLENTSGILLFRIAHSASIYSTVAASDGDNFMIAWNESATTGSNTWILKVNTDSSSSSNGPIWTSNISSDNPVGLVWTGSKYLAVWIDGYNAVMYRTEIDTSLNVGPVTTVPGMAETFPTPTGVNGPLSLNFDPLSNQALVIYRDLDQTLTGAFYMSAQRLTSAGSSAEINLDTVEGFVDFYADMAACADPQNGGWIVVWSKNEFSPGDKHIHYQAIAPDGSLRGSEQIVSTSIENAAVAIACRAHHPLLDLEFEEDATSSTYADSSQYGNDATCNLGGGACPQGGVEGRFGNGVQFDGLNDQLTSSFSQPTDEFTIEFWMRTTCQDCDILNYLGGNAEIYLENGEICYVANGVSGFGEICNDTGTNYADGEWHHVIQGSGGTAQYLWLDGDIQLLENFTFTDIDCPANCSAFVLGTAGENFFNGTLDQVKFHNRLLSHAEALQAFSSAVTILDLDETAGATTAFDASNSGFNATCSGTSCPTFGVDGVANTAVQFDGTDDTLTIDTQKRTLESEVFDFEAGNTSGWSNGTISSATREGATTHYLGNFGNQTVTLALDNLPTHDTVSIAFDLYVLGSWDGNNTETGPDIWQWGHDGISLLNTTFSNQPDTSPNYQSYPAGYPGYFEGITLYENSDFSGATETFTMTDSNLSDNPIGNDRASAYNIFVDSVAILYEDINFGGSSWIMDPKRGNNNIPPNDTVSSLRVFSALHSPEYGSTGDSLTASGYSETAVYHIEYTLDSHTADSLDLFFKGLSSDGGQERWGLDNVVVQIQSDGGSVPLTNSSFTMSAWAKRDNANSYHFILSQGTGTSFQGLNFGYMSSNKLRCAIWGESLDSPQTYTDNDWHHVACTFDATTRIMKLYRDGVLLNQYTAGGVYSGFGDTYVGSRFGNDRYFNGSLDEIGIWTQPLTDDQILELYQKVKIEDVSALRAVVPVQNGSSLLNVDLVLRETATNAGTESQVVTRTLRIDADAPTATVLAPTANAYVSGLSALELSGSASDPTSYVTAVEVQIDGGSWLPASGTENWSYAIPAGTLSDGLHTASARATDVVGFTGTGSTIQFIVDDNAPDTTILTPALMRPIRDEAGRWLVPLNGTASDPVAGSQPGSGVFSVEVLLDGGPDVVGNGWQTATISSGSWTLDYVLPLVGTENTDISDPSGVYTVTVRATDAVDNTTLDGEYITEQLTLDVDPPVPTLLTDLSGTAAITTSLTLTGQILDTTYIDSAEIGFTPGSNIGSLSESVLHLTFDENQAETQYFADRSGSNNSAGCNSETCPLVGQTGQRDLAVEFDGLTQYATVADNDSLDFGTDQDFTVALWVYADPAQPSTANSDNDIVEKWSGGGVGYPFVIRFLNQSGKIRVGRFDGQNNPEINSLQAINDGQFHHVAFVKSGATLYLYIDGVLDGTTTDTTTGDTTNSSALFLGARGNGLNHFKGKVDELVIHDHALADFEVTDLYDYGQTIWEPVNFDDTVLNPSWSYTIPVGVNGLEGIFQINVRATDVLSNVTQTDSQRMWRGEIDTLPPTVTFTATIGEFNNYTLYSCTANDFNLDEDTTCVVVPPDTIPSYGNSNKSLTDYDTVDLWYAETISDTARLYKMEANVLYPGAKPINMLIKACDIYGRCSTTSASSAAPFISEPDSPRIASKDDASVVVLGSGVLTPTLGAALTTTTPVTVSGFAIADSGVQSLTVTVNDVGVYSQNWPVSPTITNTVWSFSWTPPAQGIYAFNTSLQDWSGNTAAGLFTTTLYVDTEPPMVDISPPVLTTTHQAGNELVYLSGTSSDAVGVYRVEVSIDGGPWQQAGLAQNGNWQLIWLLDSQLDGSTISISARATDLAGHTALDMENMLVDITPPQMVTVTLAYENTGGQMQPITEDDTLTDAASLAVSWTAASDGSGIVTHRVGWSQSPTPITAELTPYPGAGTHTQSVGEAETWYAHVQLVDGAGNITTQTSGPIYVDGLLTPDVISNLNYHGWANDSCAIEGIDRRLAQAHPGLYGDTQQQFYVTWDESALRLYWQGANWNHDGDLFIYLDTRPGGSNRLFNPYPGDAGTNIYLPGNFPDPSFAGAGTRQQEAQATIGAEAAQSGMGADYMVWVEDDSQATLYIWQGFEWAVQQSLGRDFYQLDKGPTTSGTDLWMPFDQIGIADPNTAALGLLAVATEENALQLWSTMPIRNPINSDRVVNLVAGMADEHTFPLVRSYFWNSLASGLCGNGRLSPDSSGPTGGPFADSDLQLSITADPVGTTYSFINDDNAWLWSIIFGFDDVPVVPSQLFTHLDTDHAPLGPGQTVTYTIAYENLGTETAEDVIVELEDWYSLQLTGGHTVNIGDIPAGARGSVEVTAVVDPTGVDPTEQEWAALDAFVYDEQYPKNPNGGSWSSAPLEWLWSDHQVDIQAPSEVAITSPDFVIRPGVVTIRGTAVDESPVPQVNLEILTGDGNLQTITCVDDTPADGRWGCSWDSGQAADGDIFQLRVQGVDIFGQESEWSNWINLEVDATPPVLTVDFDSQGFGVGIHHLSGGLVDERNIGTIHVCWENNECTIHVVNPTLDSSSGTLFKSGVWSTYLVPPDALEIDGQSQTLIVYGEDAAGNRSETIKVTYRMDNTPPKLTVNQVTDVVSANNSHLILNGTVSDGSHCVVNVLVDPPNGLRQRMSASVVGNSWSFTTAWSSPGIYTLWVQAVDEFGNTTTVGSFTVTVVAAEPDIIYFPAFFKS
ncbi:MAG: LamG-like jellyroll fold domain-containing protein [Candidatus Promineifilaceae bacterium]